MPPTTLTRLWQRLLQWLLAITTPAAGITHEDTRRRIRLILAIDLVLVLANGLAVLILLAVLNDEPRTMLLYILPSLLAMVMGIAGYGLARTRRYVTGMQITLAGLLLNSYGAVLVTPGPEAFNYTIVIGAIPLVSSLFLSVRRTAVISAVVVAGLALVLHFHDALTRQMFENYMPLDGFARFISLLTVSGVSGVVLIAMRLRDLLEQDRLRAQEKALAEEMRAEAYKSADQVKTVFFASLSHELRTPLNAVINFTRLVTDGHAGEINADQRQLLGEVVKSGKHLLNLINDVLDMSRMEAGAFRLLLEDDVDVSSIIYSAILTTSGYIEGKPVELRTQVDPALPHIRGDKQRILQILLNLLANAGKFTAQGSITVAAQPQDAAVLISVQDTGPGIAPEDQARVFEAFQQSATGLHQGGGTGLGLSISRNLAEAHGGALWLESTPGQGATFYLRLPLQPVAQ